jgi:glycosyltransferase involved in cell wall biosynthesis
VLDDETGVLFRSQDDGALATAVMDLLGEPRTLKRLGQRAVEHARHEFSFDRYVADVESIYRRAAETASAGGPTR